MDYSLGLLKLEGFADIWKSAAKDAADAVAERCLSAGVGVSTRAYFRDNANGGSYWLEVRAPSDEIRLISAELQKEVAPLTLRVRVWFSKKGEMQRGQLLSAGLAHIGDEVVRGFSVKPRSSWEKQLDADDIELEGIEYPMRQTQFLNDEEGVELAIRTILVDVYELVTNIDSRSSKPIHVLFPDEVDPLDARLHEGAVKSVTVNRYERQKKARDACIAHHGAQCAVCGFDFEKTYGQIGSGFIHVHHRIDLSLVGEHYVVDPVKDLVPVCPNCHAMLHQRKPAYPVEELKGRVKQHS